MVASRASLVYGFTRLPVCKSALRVSVPSTFLLLCSARCRFAITPFRVDLGSLPLAKGLVLLNRSAHRLAPLVVIVRGAQLFWGFSRGCLLRAAPFSVRRSRVFAVGC